MSVIPVEETIRLDLTYVQSRIERGISESRRRGRSVLVSVTIESTKVDPLDMFARGAGLFRDRRFWSAPHEDRAVVGLGEAWSATTTGSHRISVAAEKWRALCADAIIDLPTGCVVSGPVVLAGFSFDPDQLTSQLWSEFPDGLLLLPRFAFTRVEGKSWMTVNALVSPTMGASELNASLDQMSDLLGRRQGPTPPNRSNTVVDVVDRRSPEAWKATVGDATRHLRDGHAEKVVLAISTKVTAEDAFDPAVALRKLRSDYPNCYIFAIDRGHTCFLGASPEQLARVEGSTIRTVCLAGSAPRGNTPDEDLELGTGLMESAKNRGEHAIVVHWVRDTLTRAGVDLSPLPEPTLLKFRNVQHLYTPVDGTMPVGGSVFDAIAQLHPTPSVGGQPRNAALQFIRENEGLDRGWYAGAVGWVDQSGQGEFTVAIRSAVLQGATAVLFAGCGVVPDSVPEQEYAEARVKLRPMLAAIGALPG